MRAVRCVDKAPVVVEAPAPSGEGVRVRVASAGICGSDLHLLGWELPVVMGHEFAGTTDDGTPVAVEPVAPCGVCPACVAGDHQRCVDGPAIVMGVGLDGGFADEVRVPARSLARLPAGVALRDACLVEPMAVAVHAVRRARISGGERVAVVGGGTLGLASIVAGLAAGAATVDVAARHDHQRAAAERLGGRVLDGPTEAGDGYDVVVEAAGSASALAEAVERCRPGGRVVLVGSYWDGTVELPATVCFQEIDVIPSSMYGRVGPSRDFDVAVAVLAARPEVAATLITHRFPLDAAADAFAVAGDRAGGAIKVVLEP